MHSGFSKLIDCIQANELEEFKDIFKDIVKEDTAVLEKVSPDLSLAIDHISKAGAFQYSYSGLTLMHFAVIYGKSAIVEYLAQQDPSLIDKVDGANSTPLQLAIYLQRDTEFIKTLLQLGAKIDPFVLDYSTLDKLTPDALHKLELAHTMLWDAITLLDKQDTEKADKLAEDLDYSAKIVTRSLRNNTNNTENVTQPDTKKIIVNETSIEKPPEETKPHKPVADTGQLDEYLWLKNIARIAGIAFIAALAAVIIVGIPVGIIIATGGAATPVVVAVGTGVGLSMGLGTGIVSTLSGFAVIAAGYIGSVTALAAVGATINEFWESCFPPADIKRIEEGGSPQKFFLEKNPDSSSATANTESSIMEPEPGSNPEFVPRFVPSENEGLKLKPLQTLIDQFPCLQEYISEKIIPLETLEAIYPAQPWIVNAMIKNNIHDDKNNLHDEMIKRNITIKNLLNLTKEQIDSLQSLFRKDLVESINEYIRVNQENENKRHTI